MAMTFNQDPTYCAAHAAIYGPCIYFTELDGSADVGPIVGGVTVVAVVLILATTAVIIAVIVVTRGKRTQPE